MVEVAEEAAVAGERDDHARAGVGQIPARSTTAAGILEEREG